MKALWVTDRDAIGNETFAAMLETLSGAPDLVVQLREKSASDREILEWARFTRQRLGPEVPLLINRRLDVAIAADADGVHLPADGLPLPCVRASAPRGMRVGISTHSGAEASRAIAAGADVVVLGPIFATPSKAAFGPPLGPEVLADLPESGGHEAQVFAIGGIDGDTVGLLGGYRDRIAGVAVVRWLQQSVDPRAVVDRIGRL